MGSAAGPSVRWILAAGSAGMFSRPVAARVGADMLRACSRDLDRNRERAGRDARNLQSIQKARYQRLHDPAGLTSFRKPQQSGSMPAMQAVLYLIRPISAPLISNMRRGRCGAQMQRPIAEFFRPVGNGARKPLDKRERVDRNGQNVAAGEQAPAAADAADAAEGAAAAGSGPAIGVQQYARKRKR